MNSLKLEELKNALNSLLEPLEDWVIAAAHPVKKCESLLSLPSDEERIRKSLRLLAVSFLVALVVDIPLYHAFGIDQNSVEFHLSAFLCLTFAMIAGVFAIQLSLRLYGIRARFSDVVAVYTAYTLCYQPLLNLFCYFSTARFLSLLSSSKAGSHDLDNTVRFLFEQAGQMARIDNMVNHGARLCSWVLLAILCVSSALMATEIADRYSVPRVKSFSAFSFAMVVLLPPIGLLQSMFLAYIEYTFMPAAPIPLSN